MKRHPVWEVVMIVLITVMVSFFNPYTKMGGTELVAEMFTVSFPADRQRIYSCRVGMPPRKLERIEGPLHQLVEATLASLALPFDRNVPQSSPDCRDIRHQAPCRVR